MQKRIVFSFLFVSLLFMSCQSDKHKVKADGTKNIATGHNTEMQIRSDDNGNKLEMYFDNEGDSVTIIFNTDMAELKRKLTASGFAYSNKKYELLGKGNDVILYKNGKIVFQQYDEINYVELKNKKGDILFLTFDNTTKTVKAYFNGGEQIEMQMKKTDTPSVSLYANDVYELSVENKHYVFKKGKLIIFENEK